ncbi:hypothetical protein SNOG_05192 [Parastagonospora nodorum SN15]|uniref:Uncharacterized protein n=1 Tax=Phaeosphaeria nodorum (strain SN15 / ATCC MYA-4574 / FGSC 10173) TaxID=321614 RepID=Q0USS2_PHANO|nr:hypothetical protein SNOG_05192 [Parastagonospora nodorum SN15]EAT87583.1 hypothetical protein SNOG_05192 [Parastagonospora nodorum SN15]
MACATMYYTVHTHSLASWTAKKDYCEFQKNFEAASQCSISRPPAKRAMATPWIFASDNAWGKLLSSFPTRSNLERIAAIGVIIVITALHFCDLSSLWYRIARGKQPSGSYFTLDYHFGFLSIRYCQMITMTKIRTFEDMVETFKQMSSVEKSKSWRRG